MRTTSVALILSQQETFITRLGKVGHNVPDRLIGAVPARIV